MKMFWEKDMGSRASWERGHCGMGHACLIVAQHSQKHQWCEFLGTASLVEVLKMLTTFV